MVFNAFGNQLQTELLTQNHTGINNHMRMFIVGSTLRKRPAYLVLIKRHLFELQETGTTRVPKSSIESHKRASFVADCFGAIAKVMRVATCLVLPRRQIHSACKTAAR
mgnify:CR=1 FL=1